MTGTELVERARKAKADFGAESPKKFAGAAVVEILREAFAREKIPYSKRDVFIRGIGVEIDLVIPRTGAKPELGLVYKPQDVVVALEVKKSGSYGEKGRDKIRADFQQIQRRARVKCGYISFEDRKTYKWRPTKKSLGGFECFNLAWHKQADGPLVATEDWKRLLEYLKGSLRSVRHR